MDMTDWSTDRIERLATGAETEIARQRAVQAAALAELDRRQTPSADGCRSLAEWTASRLDVSPETARDLARVARGAADRPDLAAALASGEVGFDRRRKPISSMVSVSHHCRSSTTSRRGRSSSPTGCGSISRTTRRRRRWTNV